MPIPDLHTKNLWQMEALRMEFFLAVQYTILKPIMYSFGTKADPGFYAYAGKWRYFKSGGCLLLFPTHQVLRIPYSWLQSIVAPLSTPCYRCLCGRPDGLELSTGQPPRPGSQQRQLQATAEEWILRLLFRTLGAVEMVTKADPGLRCVSVPLTLIWPIRG